MSVLSRYVVVLILAVILLPRTGVSLEIADKCDVEYRRCQFFCVEENPLDIDKLAKCNRKCKFNRIVCKTKVTTKNLWHKIKEVIHRSP